MRIARLALLLALGCGTPPATRSAEPVARRPACTVTLRFENADDLGGDDPSIVALPHTRVTLVRICDPGGTETRLVGNEVGVCQFANPSDRPGDALLRARCWWAGQGSELEVHRVLRQLVVRRAVLDEETGLGPFTDAVDLDLPASAQLSVLGPETLPHPSPAHR